MEKRCAFCEYRTSDDQEFSQHVLRVHNWAPRRRARSGVARVGLLSCALVALLVIAPCGLFFLSYNGFPPFQVSDESGQQFELHRSVPGTVRYSSGWTVTVERPQEIGPAAGLRRVWLIPITVVNGESSNATLGVGVCQPTFDGRTVDPYFQAAALRALGDVDRPTALPPGGSATGRLAVAVPEDARTALLNCGWHAMVKSIFDLTPYLARRP